MKHFPLSDVFRAVPFKDVNGTDVLLLQAWSNNYKWETIAAFVAGTGAFHIKASSVSTSANFDTLGWSLEGKV